MENARDPLSHGFGVPIPEVARVRMAGSLKGERPMSRTAAAVVLASLALLAPAMGVTASTTSNSHAAARPRPNVLFIITDQQFAEAMSCRMGRQYLHTPAMDGLAARGVLFSRAYSSNPLCMPYRNSVFTGRYPHETGVTRNDKPEPPMDPKVLVCMGRYFRDAGYETPYAGKWHLAYGEKDTQAHGFEILKGRSSGGHDEAVTEHVLQFLARPHTQPFLLVASYLNPHNICEWARRLAGRKQGLNCGEIGMPPALDQLPPAPFNLAPPKNEPDGMTLMRRAYQVEEGPFPVAKFTADDWRKHRWGYYRMVERVDKEIGRVLDALHNAGLEEDTLVVFTADHGECAGAHGFNQKTVFYEESARVPLIVSWKGRTPQAVCDKLVNTGVDILPTILEAAGLAVPDKLPGRSLLPLALGGDASAWREYVVVENDMSQTGVVDGMKPTMEGRMVRTDRYKYCVYTRGRQRESLVDLQADPGETTDLAADPTRRQVLREHRAILAQFGKEHNDTLVTKLLADDVKPIPFTAQTTPGRAKKRGTR
jgi:arylsulfatase A-like enzyme